MTLHNDQDTIAANEKAKAAEFEAAAKASLDEDTRVLVLASNQTGNYRLLSPCLLSLAHANTLVAYLDSVLTARHDEVTLVDVDHGHVWHMLDSMDVFRLDIFAARHIDLLQPAVLMPTSEPAAPATGKPASP